MACEIKEKYSRSRYFENEGGTRYEGETICKTHVREVQNYQTQRQSYGNL